MTQVRDGETGMRLAEKRRESVRETEWTVSKGTGVCTRAS